MRQRYLQTFIYQLQDEQGELVEGFERVAMVLTSSFQKQLGGQPINRVPIDRTIMLNGPCLTIEQQLQLLEPIND